MEPEQSQQEGKVIEPTITAPLSIPIPPPPPIDPYLSVSRSTKAPLVVWVLSLLLVLALIVIGILGYVLLQKPTGNTSAIPSGSSIAHSTAIALPSSIVTPIPSSIPTPPPYKAQDILSAFSNDHLLVSNPLAVQTLPNDVPYPPSDIISFQGGGNSEQGQMYIAVLSSPAEATADSEAILAYQKSMFSPYAKQRCLLLTPITMSMASESSYMDTMSVSCT